MCGGDEAADDEPGVYLLWWSIGAASHPHPRAAHHEMYVGSTGGLKHRLGSHQRSRGNPESDVICTKPVSADGGRPAEHQGTRRARRRE